MKKLIINADDFGLSRGINDGIKKSVSEGIVTSVSLVACGSEYEDALSFIKKNKNLDIGIHLVLIEEKPLLNKHEISSLVDKDGRFLKNWKSFISRFATGRIRVDQVKQECETQIVKVLNSNLEISHIDSHCHIHLLPVIMDVIIKLAKRYKIKFIRTPLEQADIRRLFTRNGIKTFILALLSLQARIFFSINGLRSANFTFGFYCSGILNIRIFSKIIKEIEGLPDSVIELICHPGTSQAQLDYPHWRYCFEDEMNMLTSVEARNIVENAGIELSNYKLVEGILI